MNYIMWQQSCITLMYQKWSMEFINLKIKIKELALIVKVRKWGRKTFYSFQARLSAPRREINFVTNVAVRNVLGSFLETEDAKRLAKWYTCLLSNCSWKRTVVSTVQFIRFWEVQNLPSTKRLEIIIWSLQTLRSHRYEQKWITY